MMPSVGSQTTILSTPRFSGLELMERVNALYQSGFIGSDDKASMTNLILFGMDTGDYTKLIGLITEQCRRSAPENPFWDQMKEILRERIT